MRVAYPVIDRSQPFASRNQQPHNQNLHHHGAPRRLTLSHVRVRIGPGSNSIVTKDIDWNWWQILMYLLDHEAGMESHNQYSWHTTSTGNIKTAHSPPDTLVAINKGSNLDGGSMQGTFFHSFSCHSSLRGGCYYHLEAISFFPHSHISWSILFLVKSISKSASVDL